ncbi:MAG: hypothetical protein ACXW3V_08255, partial [Methylocystis sp.]
KIVEDHGGRLELLDAPSGRGACVRLIVPLAAETSSKEESRAAGAQAEKAPAHASVPGQSGV